MSLDANGVAQRIQSNSDRRLGTRLRSSSVYFRINHVSGPDYIKALKGPFPQIPLIASGGVNQKNAADFIQAGAAALVSASSPAIPEYGERSAQPADDLTRRGTIVLRFRREARQEMNGLTLFGLLAVTLMLVFYALEKRSQGAWPFGMVKAVWSGVALRRWWLEATRQ